jgi:hypothetical protein
MWCAGRHCCYPPLFIRSFPAGLGAGIYAAAPADQNSRWHGHQHSRQNSVGCDCSICLRRGAEQCGRSGRLVIIVSFATKRLRVLCEDPKVAKSKLGEDIARLLRARLADLRSADGLFDLPTGNPRVDGGSYLLNLGASATMRWEPYGKSAEPADTGVLDWNCVNRVKLVGIDRGTQ